MMEADIAKKYLRKIEVLMLDLTTEVSLHNLPGEAAAAIELASENIKKALEHLEEE